MRFLAGSAPDPSRTRVDTGRDGMGRQPPEGASARVCVLLYGQAMPPPLAPRRHPEMTTRSSNGHRTLMASAAAVPTRRRFIESSVAALAATLLPAGRVFPASDAPEVSDLKLGIIALTDCSPLVIA